MSDILVDTSAWMEFFGNGDGPIAYAVYRLIREDRAAVCGVVFAELLQAAETQKEKDKLKRNLTPLRFVEADRRDWLLAGTLLSKLRKRSIRAPLSTALMSVLCVRHNLAILTLDKNFAHFHEIQWYAVK